MQCTGFKGVQGKLILEDDILEFGMEPDAGGVSRLVNEDGAWIVKYPSGRISDIGYFTCKIAPNGVMAGAKVIGNIYIYI
jgi:hypothetical protein